jgi:predicted Zn-dependent protease
LRASYKSVHQAREILAVHPRHPQARLLLGQAARLGGHTQAALTVLGPLARELPHSGAVLLELGIALGEAGRLGEAVVALEAASGGQPDSPEAWRVLADHMDAPGDARAVDDARARLRRYPDAQQLLERCLELAPSFHAARYNYAVVLNRQARAAEALAQIEPLAAAAA